MKHLHEHNPFVPAIAALALAAVAVVSGISAVSFLTSMHDPQVAAAADAFPAPLILNPSALSSDAALVFDPASGYVLFAKNSAALPLHTVSDARLLATSTDTAAAQKALTAIPSITSVATFGTAFAEASLCVVFDADIGHPLVAVVLGGTPESRVADIKQLINTSRH